MEVLYPCWKKVLIFFSFLSTCCIFKKYLLQAGGKRNDTSLVIKTPAMPRGPHSPGVHKLWGSYPAECPQENSLSDLLQAEPALVCAFQLSSLKLQLGREWGCKRNKKRTKSFSEANLSRRELGWLRRHWSPRWPCRADLALSAAVTKMPLAQSQLRDAKASLLHCSKGLPNSSWELIPGNAGGTSKEQWSKGGAGPCSAVPLPTTPLAAGLCADWLFSHAFPSVLELMLDFLSC